MLSLQSDKKLDNPVWHSLNEAHEEFSLNYDNLKCYDVEFCPFGGSETGAPVPDQIDKYANLIDNFFIVGEKPDLSQRLSLNKELVCLQMITDHAPVIKIDEEIIKLTEKHAKELLGLVNLVQPGYFKTKTMLLGDYYGIFKNGTLVAVTGERMKMNNFTEVSAVVTHPDHTGKGYAKQLVAHAVSKVFDEKKIPYLHVAETNTGAIMLYEKLGFTVRRKISFWNFQKK